MIEAEDKKPCDNKLDKKVGKTTTALNFVKDVQPGNKVLLLAFEQGFRNITTKFTPLSISDYNTYRNVIKSLEADAKAVREGKKDDVTYEVIVFDSIDILYDMIVNHVCAIHSVSSLDQTPQMCGYKQAQRLYEQEILKLMKATNKDGQLLYTTIYISHSQIADVKHPLTKVKHTTISPSADKRCSAVTSKHCDSTLYFTTIENADGLDERVAVVRSANIEAGSRYKYLPNVLPLDYVGIRDNVIMAIEKQIEEDGVITTNTNKSLIANDVEYDFDALMNEAREIYSIFDGAGKGAIFANIVEQEMGTGKRLSDCTPINAPVIYAVVTSLKEKATELGLA